VRMSAYQLGTRRPWLWTNSRVDSRSKDNDRSAQYVETPDIHFMGRLAIVPNSEGDNTL